MSKYTGKEPCVYSEFTMFGDEGKTINEQLINTIIYCKNEILDIKTERELVPYYGNMCGIICATREDGKIKKNIHISSVPYFLSQDWEWIERLYKDVQRIWRYCQRKKIPFDFTYVQSKVWMGDEELALPDIVKDVAEHPYKKIECGKYHSTRWGVQHYRELMIETMKKYGYTDEQIYEWVWNGKRTW